MKTYLLRREQWVPRPVEVVFAYFAEAQNLESVTPPWLAFRILTPLPIVMQAGTRITYRIRLHGCPIRWVTEIENWEPPTQFVDIQLRGPYRFWHHTHRFEAVDGGTRISDTVQYALPLGPLGRLANRWFVQADLAAVFDYRAEQVASLFGPPRGTE